MMRLFKSIWHVLTLHCEEASRLTSESIDHPLAAADEAAVRLHRVSCASCRREHAQIVAIHEAALKLANPSEVVAIEPLPEEVRDRIRTALKQD